MPRGQNGITFPLNYFLMIRCQCHLMCILLVLSIGMCSIYSTTYQFKYVSIMTYAEFVDDVIAESVSFQSNSDVTKKHVMCEN